MPPTTFLYGVITALVVGFSLQPVVLRIMLARAILDVPCERSSHTIPTPRGGGVAVALAGACALLVNEPTRAFAVPLVLFAAIGLLEDVRGAPIRVRLVLQAGAGTAGALALIPAEYPTAVLAAAVAAGALWLTAYANVFNFMDGVNGISAAHGILGGTVYAVIGWSQGLPALATGGAAVAAASLTFLPWNAGRARIFLGDVGSYGLGGVLGALALYGLTRGVPVEAVVAPLALYLADTGWTLTKRWRQGEVWYRPHRSHAYQRLTDLGWSHQRVTAVTAGIGGLVSACGVGTLYAPSLRLVLGAGALVILTAYLASPSFFAARRMRTTEQAINVREGQTINA